jgi:hypothetical protein
VVEKRKDLNSYFAETVDYTLKQIFKEDGTKVIYEFLENNSSLKLEEVADKPEVSSATMKSHIFSAAQVIKKTILMCKTKIRVHKKDWIKTSARKLEDSY